MLTQHRSKDRRKWGCGGTGGNLLVAVVGGGGLGGARLQRVVAAAVVVGLHVEVAVHAVADLQLRTNCTTPQ